MPAAVPTTPCRTAGRRRPGDARAGDPPTVAPTAMSPAAANATSATTTRISAVTALTTPARRSSGSAVARTAKSRMPWPAPKYPPYTPAPTSASRANGPASVRPGRRRATTAAVIRGCRTMSTSATRMSAGTTTSKASSGRVSSSAAPASEPVSEPVSDHSAYRAVRRPCPASVSRSVATAANDPGTSPTVLVTFATTGG